MMMLFGYPVWEWLIILVVGLIVYVSALILFAKPHDRDKELRDRLTLDE